MRLLLPVLLLLAQSTLAQTWTQLPDFPGTARDDAAAFAIGTHAYFGTGMETGWGLTSNWWMVDVVGWPQWQPVPDLPGEARQYCIGFSIATQGFVFGGLAAGGPLNELWSYSEDGTGWTQRASLPAPGRYASTAFISGDKAYVVGGILEGGTATNECWSYDPATDLWAQVANMPGIARHRAASFAYAAFGYVVGGADSAFHALSETWKYNPGSNQWTPAAPLPEPRYDAAPLSEIELGIVGGASDDTTFHANEYAYDPVADSWSEMMDSLPYGIRGLTGTYTGGGGGWYFNVVGTGLDNDLVRHKEMFYDGFVFGIEESLHPTVTIVPNPGSDCFLVSGLKTTMDILVCDAIGKSVLRVHGSSGSITTQEWSKGLYLIAITDVDGNIYRTRWIKQ